MPYGLSKFCRFAVNVWEVNPAGKADEQVAREGLSCMEVWMKELGLTMNLHELGGNRRNVAWYCKWNHHHGRWI